MLKVRQMMTEVLLEVTNREVADVAQSVHASEKRKQAKGIWKMHFASAAAYIYGTGGKVKFTALESSCSLLSIASQILSVT